MAIEIISTLKPKNNGDFPVAEAADVSVDKNGTRLDAKLKTTLTVVTTAKAMDEILANATADDVGTFYLYMGATTDKYENSAVYGVTEV